jgi:hypothetical protein
MSLRSHLSFVCVVLAFASFGCSDDGQLKPARLRVGTATSGDVVFAAAVDDVISIYVCGGDTTYATHTRWFRDIPLDEDGGFAATLEGWTISGTAESDDSGNIMAELVGPADEQVSIRGTSVPEDGLAGLYTQEIDGCTTGLVVRGSDDDPQTQGTWCDDQSQFAQVIVLQPVVLTAEGIHVQVMRPDPLPLADFYVEPF